MTAEDAPAPNSTRAGRRATDPAVATPQAAQPSPPVANLPVPVGKARTVETNPPAGPVEAQILGQQGEKRGLRGGPPVLNQARSAYLGAEWSGSANRRPKPGVVTVTKV